MTLPAPNLDDRRFQDLVDEAKRHVQRRCPEWTDHNVSDPGVTLIETFAFMVDQLLYRLNRVPDRVYVKFLDLLGISLYPPAAARVEVTFWLSSPRGEPVAIPAGTQVATERTETQDPVTFTVEEDFTIVPADMGSIASSTVRGRVHDHTSRFALGEGFHCFDATPKPGDALMVGLTRAVPSCAVLLQLDCEIEGVGVDPENPPLVWEAWTGDGWDPCDVERDETGGLNRAGDVVLHVPRGHAESAVGARRAGWIRCRVTPTEPDQPRYRNSPLIRRVQASTIGGTAATVNADIVAGEVLGTSDGGAAQVFPLRNRPLVRSDEPIELEVSSPAGWERWRAVSTFAESGPADRVFELDEAAGEIRLAPAIRQPDGSLRPYGAIPPPGAVLRIPSYRWGGGRRGNVAARAIAVLTSSIPYVARVENRSAATGGVDGEDVDAAKARAPQALRTRGRAVTTADFEYLVQDAAPEVARVRALGVDDGEDAGVVRVVLIPDAEDGPDGVPDLDHLVPRDDVLERIARHLDERRVVGARVVVEPAAYQVLTVVARLRSVSGEAQRVSDAATAALNRHFHPIRGGPDGSGWPFGRPVHIGEVFGLLQRLPGVQVVEDVRLFPADPTTRRRRSATQRLDLAPNEVVLSYDHQVLVEDE